MMRFPDRRPTPSEYAVIAVVFASSFIVLGISALVFAFRASSDHPVAAAALANRGWWFLGIGIFIAFAFWLVRRFFHS